MTSTASTTQPQPSTQLPPAIANLLASTTTTPQGANGNFPTTPATNNPVPATIPPLVRPSNNNTPRLPQQPQSTPPAPTPPPPTQFNIPPLPVFLNMPPPMQQQIFRSVPVHIQQQMLSSLPPPLQNQLGPLLGTSATNNAPLLPVSKSDFNGLLSVCFN